jgi:hypothetical protein
MDDTRTRVEEIKHLEQRADIYEAEAQEARWRVAALMAAEMDEGLRRQRRLAEEIGKSQSHVSKCVAVSRKYGADTPENRPAWHDAYREVSGKDKAKLTEAVSPDDIAELEAIGRSVVSEHLAGEAEEFSEHLAFEERYRRNEDGDRDDPAPFTPSRPYPTRPDISAGTRRRIVLGKAEDLVKELSLLPLGDPMTPDLHDAIRASLDKLRDAIDWVEATLEETPVIETDEG